MKTLSWIIWWKHKFIFCKIMNDIDNLENSKKLYCSVWIEIKNWIELNWIEYKDRIWQCCNLLVSLKSKWQFFIFEKREMEWVSVYAIWWSRKLKKIQTKLVSVEIVPCPTKKKFLRLQFFPSSIEYWSLYIWLPSFFGRVDVYIFETFWNLKLLYWFKDFSLFGRLRSKTEEL